MFPTPDREQSAARGARESGGCGTPGFVGPPPAGRVSRTRPARAAGPVPAAGLAGFAAAAHRAGVAALRLPLAVYGYFARQWRNDLTDGGKALVWCIALSGVGTVSVQMPLYQTFCALVMLLAVASGACSVLRPRVTLAHDLPARATAGGIVTGPVTLTNRRRFLPAFDVCVGFHDLPDAFAEVPERVVCPYLPAGARATVPVELRPVRRGRHPLPPLRAWSTFPFHVGRGTSRRGEAAGSLLVRPAFRPMGDLPIPGGGGRGEGGADAGARAGESPEFLGNRELLPGEHARRLDVRAWARTGRPVVRQFREERPAGVAVLLDPRGEPGPGFEAAVSRAAAAADAVARGGGALALFSDGTGRLRFRPGDARGAAGAVLDELALARPVPAAECPDPFGGPGVWGSLDDVSAVVLVSAGPPDAGLLARFEATGRRALPLPGPGAGG